MKKYRNLTFVLFTMFLLLGATGCTKEYNTINQGAFSEKMYYTVYAKDWKWNDQVGRYEFFINESKITKDIYNYGAIVGSVFINPDTNDETQESLPSVFSRMGQLSGGGLQPYTETISFDAVPGGVGFYIQYSDLGRDDSLLGDYEFKITLFWD